MNTRLYVLGVLTYSPMSGYDIKKLSEERRTDLWADVLPGSIYHALGGLQKDGHVAVRASESRGHRMRTVYEITQSGRVELGKLVREAFAVTPRSFPSGIYMALSLAMDVPKGEMLSLLEGLADRIREQIGYWEYGERMYTDQGVMKGPLRLTFDNGLTHLRADLDFANRLIAFYQGEHHEP